MAGCDVIMGKFEDLDNRDLTKPNKKVKVKERFVFKINKTNGTKYLQIWEFDDLTNKYVFIKSCGSPEKLYNKLVKLGKLLNQTKE